MVNFQTTQDLIRFCLKSELWIHIHVINAYVYTHCKSDKNLYVVLSVFFEEDSPGFPDSSIWG